MQRCGAVVHGRFLVDLACSSMFSVLFQVHGEVYQEAAMHYRAASLHIEPLEGKAEQLMRRAKNMLGLAWAKTCAEGIILAMSAAYIVVHVLAFALRAQEIGLLRALGL